jgi:hypothetical protein
MMFLEATLANDTYRIVTKPEIVLGLIAAFLFGACLVLIIEEFVRKEK